MNRLAWGRTKSAAAHVRNELLRLRKQLKNLRSAIRREKLMIIRLTIAGDSMKVLEHRFSLEHYQKVAELVKRAMRSYSRGKTPHLPTRSSENQGSATEA